MRILSRGDDGSSDLPGAVFLGSILPGSVLPGYSEPPARARPETMPVPPRETDLSGLRDFTAPEASSLTRPLLRLSDAVPDAFSEGLAEGLSE